MEQKPSVFSMVFSFHEKFHKFIQEQTFKKNWLDYEDIVGKQLHYWAKTGDFENFAQAVVKFDITVFKRVEVEYADNQRMTIARYHVGLQSADFSSSSSLDDDEDFEAQPAQKKPKK